MSNLFLENVGRIFRLGHGWVTHEVLLEATKATFASTNFIVVNANEVTTIDNT
jgi:hypothetical protein